MSQAATDRDRACQDIVWLPPTADCRGPQFEHIGLHDSWRVAWNDMIDAKHFSSLVDPNTDIVDRL